MRDDDHGRGYSPSRGDRRKARSDSRENESKRRPLNSGDRAAEVRSKRQRFRQESEDSRIDGGKRTSQAAQRTSKTRSEAREQPRRDARDKQEAPPRRPPVQRKPRDTEGNKEYSYYSEDEPVPKQPPAQKPARARANPVRGRPVKQNDDVYSYYSDDEPVPARPSRPKAAGKGQTQDRKLAGASSPQTRATTDPYMQNGDTDGHGDDRSSRRTGAGNPNAVHAGVDFKALYKSRLDDAKSRITAGGKDAEEDPLDDEDDRARGARRQKSPGSASGDLSDEEARLAVNGSKDTGGRRTGFGWSHSESIATAEPQDLNATEELHAAVAAKLLDDPGRNKDDSTAASTGFGAAVGVQGVGASGIDFSLVRQARQAAENLQSRQTGAQPQQDLRPQQQERQDVRKSTALPPNGKSDGDYFNASKGAVCGPEDRFIIQEEIGRGTFTSVYKCRDALVPQIEYAIRFTKSTYGAGSAHLREATNKEVNLLGRICTQVMEVDPKGARHILGLMFLDAFDHAGHIAMVFQLMKCNLRVAMKRYTQGRGFPLLPTVRSLGYQIFLALRALRRVEVIHCDVKPDNILLAFDRETVKLSDFGGARKTVDREFVEYYSSGSYRAPEVILGQACSYQIDIWGAGATLFELGTGEILFNGEGNNAVVHEMLQVCGAFPTHMIKGKFASKHFSEDTGDFKLAKSTTIRTQDFANPLRPISRMLEKALRDAPQGVDPNRYKGFVSYFSDLLNRCLVIDPSLRSTPDDALRCKFLANGM